MTVDSLYYGKKPILEMKIGNNTFYKSPGWESPVGSLRLANTKTITTSGPISATNKNIMVWRGRDSNDIEIRDNDAVLLKSYTVPIYNWYVHSVDPFSGIIIGAADTSSSYRLFDSNLTSLNYIQNVLETGRKYKKILSINNGTIGLLVQNASILSLITNPYTSKALRKNVILKNEIMSISTDGVYFYVLSGTPDPKNPYDYYVSPFFISKVDGLGNIIGSTSFKLPQSILSTGNLYSFDAVGNFFCVFDSSSNSYPDEICKILTNGTVINAVRPKNYQWLHINNLSIDKFGNLFFEFNRPGNTYDQSHYVGVYDNKLKNFNFIKGDGSTSIIYSYALSDARVIVKQKSTYKWYEEVTKS